MAEAGKDLARKARARVKNGQFRAESVIGCRFRV
jgi:hypothetical protein